MKRWLLPTALLLSVGFNLGLLSSYLLRPDPPRPAVLEEAPPRPVVAPEPAETVPMAAPAEAEPEPELVLAPEPEATPSPAPESAVREPTPESAPASEAEPVAAEPEPQTPPSSQAESPTARQETAATPQAEPPRRRPGQLADFEQVADRLGLEGAQRDQFLSDHFEFSARVRRIAPRTVRLRREFFRELSSEFPDEDKIKRLTQQLGAANVALERALADVILKTRRHLDPAQQQAYLRFVQSRMQRIQEFVRRSGQRARQGGPQRPVQRRRPGRNPGF